MEMLLSAAVVGTPQGVGGKQEGIRWYTTYVCCTLYTYTYVYLRSAFLAPLGVGDDSRREQHNLDSFLALWPNAAFLPW